MELIFEPPSPIQNMVVIMPVFQGYVTLDFLAKLMKTKSEGGLVVRLGEEKLPAAEEVSETTEGGSALAKYAGCVVEPVRDFRDVRSRVVGT